MLEGAAAWAVSVVRFVMDQRAWKLGQCRALGLLLFLGRRWCCLQRLKLGFNRRDIGIDQVIEQLACSGFICSLRLANFKRLSWAISWVSFSMTV
jgi:hypothetical protein